MNASGKPSNAGSGPNSRADVRTCGPDRVEIHENRIIIDALHEMPDWTVREFARLAIYSDNRRYMLRERAKAQRPFAIRYTLVPWPESDHSTTPNFCIYDEKFVLEREALLKTERFNYIIHLALVGFSAILGFLWSGTKDRLSRFGLDPRNITGLSIFLEFLLCVLQGVFWTIQLWASAAAKTMAIGGLIRAFISSKALQSDGWGLSIAALDTILTLLWMIDFLVRYNNHVINDERDRCWGFLEWLSPAARKPRPIVIPEENPPL